MPLEVQNELAWAASFILVALILSLNLFARWLGTIRLKVIPSSAVI
jgi:phosphate transport system permease protein